MKKKKRKNIKFFFCFSLLKRIVDFFLCDKKKNKKKLSFNFFFILGIFKFQEKNLFLRIL
jgi:hypothetical protein